MKKKSFIFFIVMLSFSKTFSQSKKNFVEVYRFADHNLPIGKPFYKLLEKRQYSNDQLDFNIEYRGALFADTTYFRYDSGRLIVVSRHNDIPHKGVENVNYIYKNGKFDHMREVDSTKTLDDAAIGGYLEYLKNDNIFNLRDSLHLISKQLSDLNLDDRRNVKTILLNNGLNKTTFTLEYPYPYILLTYGIDYRTPIKRICFYYTKNRELVKQEFLYEKMTVTRNYSYKNDLIEYIYTKTADYHGKTYWYEILHFVLK